MMDTTATTTCPKCGTVSSNLIGLEYEPGESEDNEIYVYCPECGEWLDTIFLEAGEDEDD